MRFPAGASVHKFGGLGYVGFAEEVRAQEKALGFTFDYIVVCTVTGSTHAGMVVGVRQRRPRAQGDRHRMPLSPRRRPRRRCSRSRRIRPA